MEDNKTNSPAPPDERNFRPLTLDDFIGQSDLKKTLRLMLDSASGTFAK